jgi:hypothetical protein
LYFIVKKKIKLIEKIEFYYPLNIGISNINEMYRSFSTSSLKQGAALNTTEDTESMLTFKQPTE